MQGCLETILSRHSVRSFAPDPVPDDILQKILEAGRAAPSAQNRQCWRFIVVRDKETIRKLALKSGFIGTINFFLKDVPLIIVACADPKQSVHLNGQDYYLVDTSIAFQQMMLAALDFGIGSCWLAAIQRGLGAKNPRYSDKNPGRGDESLRLPERPRKLLRKPGETLRRQQAPPAHRKNCLLRQMGAIIYYRRNS